MKKVLIVVDMQNDFITGCLGNEECQAVVSEVEKVIKKGDYDHVFVTKDTHTNGYLDTQEGKKLPVKHCVRGTEGWEIHPVIKKALEEKFGENKMTEVDKESFGSLELGTMLKKYVEVVEEEVEYDFVGVCTGICVISNVLIAKAAVPESKVCVIEKACACVTKETHKNAIEAMKTCQVDIL